MFSNSSLADELSLHVVFFIRNHFIRKLGWESQKNKKKSKKKARLNFINAQEIRKYLGLNIIPIPPNND